MSRKGPIPPEHQEIARGSGAAAILMFLHIAATGYLAFTAYYLLRHNLQVFWTLSPLSAGMFYYLPAAFAVFTRLPSDPLTGIVSRVAQIAGVISFMIFAGGYTALLVSGQTNRLSPIWETGVAAVAGLLGAMLLRLMFGALTGPAREKYKKNAPENELPE